MFSRHTLHIIYLHGTSRWSPRYNLQKTKHGKYASIRHIIFLTRHCEITIHFGQIKDYTHFEKSVLVCIKQNTDNKTYNQPSSGFNNGQRIISSITFLVTELVDISSSTILRQDKWFPRTFKYSIVNTNIYDYNANSERSEECIDFTMIITSRNNAPISKYGGGFRCKSEYPWCIIE
ncbi:Uncharacterized protein FWK35_00016959, partial [Aphis craccivora]